MKGPEINKTAKETFERLTQQDYFNKVKQIELKIYENKNGFNKALYWQCQDQLNFINGEIRIAYAELKALQDTYTAVRKVEMLQNKKSIVVNGKLVSLSREPGNDLLTEFVYSEITELVSVITVVYHWLFRINEDILVCRNHTYGSSGLK